MDGRGTAVFRPCGRSEGAGEGKGGEDNGGREWRNGEGKEYLVLAVEDEADVEQRARSRVALALLALVGRGTRDTTQQRITFETLLSRLCTVHAEGEGSILKPNTVKSRKPTAVHTPSCGLLATGLLTRRCTLLLDRLSGEEERGTDPGRN